MHKAYMVSIYMVISLINNTHKQYVAPFKFISEYVKVTETYCIDIVGKVKYSNNRFYFLLFMSLLCSDVLNFCIYYLVYLDYTKMTIYFYVFIFLDNTYSIYLLFCIGFIYILQFIFRSSV